MTAAIWALCTYPVTAHVGARGPAATLLRLRPSPRLSLSTSLGAVVDSKEGAMLPLVMCAYASRIPGVYENPGIGLRTRSAPVYENVRNL